jgi:hypothetical protein
MGVTTPKTVKKFRDLEADFGTSQAQALFQKAAQTVNYINACVPVGKILLFHATQDNLPEGIDTRYWQKMDGSAVTNPLSPLFGQTLPDLRKRFWRHPTTGETVHTLGGANTIDLTHNHGGYTGYTDDRDDFQMDNGEEKHEANVHRHSIANGSGVVSTIPQYRELQVWVRIV